MMCTNNVTVLSRDRQAVILPTAAAFLWSRTSLLKEFWDLVRAVEGWSGAVIDENRSGLSFTLNGVEFGQLNWGGQFVLMVGPEARNAIVAEKTAEVDSVQPDGNRVVIDIASAIDLNRALCLLRLARSFARGADSSR